MQVIGSTQQGLKRQVSSMLWHVAFLTALLLGPPLLIYCSLVFPPPQWHSFSRSRRERPSWALGLGALCSCWGNFTEISYTLRKWEAEGTQCHQSCYEGKAKAHTRNQWVTQGINWNKNQVFSFRISFWLQVCESLSDLSCCPSAK